MNDTHPNEIDFILKTLRAEAGGEKACLDTFKIKDFDWTWLIDTCQIQKILPLIGHYWEKQNLLSQFPASIVHTIKSSMLIAQGKADQKLRAFKDTALLLNQSNIPIIPLKGIALLLTVYKNTPYRLMSDLDILIHKRDLHRTELALRKASFWPQSSGWSGLGSRYRWRDQLFPRNLYGSSGFVKNKIPVDLHWDPHYFVGQTRVNIGAETFWARASALSEIAPNVYQLSELDLFDVVLFHALDFHSPVFLQFFDLALMKNRYHITLDHIRAKNLPDTCTDKRPSMNHFLTAFEEIFFSEQAVFSESTKKIINDVIAIQQRYASAKKVPPPKRLLPWDYFKQLKNARQRFTFIAGYFSPNPEYYAPDKGLKMHLRHWKEVILSCLSFLAGRSHSNPRSA